MKKKQPNYYNELRKLEEKVVKEIIRNLKRIGRDFTANDETPIDFFGFSTPVEQGINKITREGLVMFDAGDNYSMERAVNEANIPLADAISILNDLREIKTPKKK